MLGSPLFASIYRVTSLEDHPAEYWKDKISQIRNAAIQRDTEKGLFNRNAHLAVFRYEGDIFVLTGRENKAYFKQMTLARKEHTADLNPESPDFYEKMVRFVLKPFMDTLSTQPESLTVEDKQ